MKNTQCRKHMEEPSASENLCYKMVKIGNDKSPKRKLVNGDTSLCS